MKQKVEFFEDEHKYELERKINKFAETHHIENISYSVNEIGYSTWHYCCVLYTDLSFEFALNRSNNRNTKEELMERLIASIKE